MHRPPHQDIPHSSREDNASCMSPGRRGKAKKSSWMLGATTLLGVFVLVSVATRFFGHLQGEEFSPTTFERRTFTYHQIPLLRVQASPVVRVATTNELESFIRREILESPDSAREPRWDLVRALRSGRRFFGGDAEILCAYLDANSSSERLIWQQWSEENEELARILWTEVQRLADYGLYLLVPDLFELAERPWDTQGFQQAVDQQLARRYEQLAAIEDELGNASRAELLRERAETHRARERATSDAEQSAGVFRRLIR